MNIHPEPSRLINPKVLAGGWVILSERLKTPERGRVLAALSHEITTLQETDEISPSGNINLIFDRPDLLSHNLATRVKTAHNHSLITLANGSQLHHVILTNPQIPGNLYSRSCHVVLAYYKDTADSRWRSMGTPYSLLLLAGSLEQSGHSVEICPIQKDMPRLTAKQQPDLLAIGVYEDTITELKNTLARLELPSHIPIVFGGPMVTLSPVPATAVLAQGNVFIRGEAECVLPDIVSLCDVPDSKTLLAIAAMDGVLMLGDGYAAMGNFHKVIQVEDFTEVKPSFSHLTRDDRINGLEYSASRGCPRSCVFCSHVHGKKHRKLPVDIFQHDLISARKALNDILPIESKNPITLNLNDDDLLLDMDQAIGIFQAVRESGFQLWGIQTSIESLANSDKRRELFTIISDRHLFAGQKPVLWLGTDAFINTRLKRLAKQGSESMIYEVCADLDRFDLSGYHYWILTDAASDWQEFMNELMILVNLGESYPQTFHVLPNAGCLIPYPSTPIYKRRMKTHSHRQIALKEIVWFDKAKQLGYPLVLHEMPCDNALYSLVEPRSIAPDRLLINSEAFIDLLRQGRFTEALLQAVNVLSRTIDDCVNPERRTELIEVKNCIMNRWYN